ncbi:sulfate ABC transporter substrate-binding protein [Anabaena cylindrica FACHB-243]|uniref:Sulfate ABC transporter, periplasmic sulfate-binding protein n=1 Tax=Anabaena cylindrica (strain ATCC 27899 / PCC 7122) TaxID=272123 RepID=K9ZAC9_ANACC|nr:MULTISPECIES: sulfate ABC transporter substrate-binding protein [Anabaena]AFZ55679.1 sulfate ABC transporter, periplasmic sulfate-binding protein [Anabaena cylindrica PCC 7122]MBD2420313.1 sulfate ABC transporter substrate-binding protein [Anabaena cylindrica FACHB-243]MBY5282072.1 sulfate ABC transporter substrate-binding protein [Anabaena sp. CCAP 1446/1C]MBY5309630.1 sulfate ABC transporter substrate-binding protein [Anabaena sp. CCAP 1446/1C]MCM2406028.1 sulfate ABC transporter substrat
MNLRSFKQLQLGFKLKSLKSFVSLFLTGIFLSVSVAACSGTNESNSADTPGASPVAASKPNVELTLVSFAVTKAAHEAIIPKFVEKWKQEHNQTVTFKQSYGGSGSQTRAVIDGLEADVVHLALSGDTQKIEKAGLIEPAWEKEVPNNGIVSKSVAAIITRPGNPKGIKTWEDLGKDGIKVITADPKTSGIAKWNFLALWNSVVKTGGDEAKATEFVSKVYKNVPILTKDAREATDAFAKQGQGDALINYENEVILAQQKGERVDYVVPDVNISIDNPIAVVDKNVDKHGTREVAEGFIKFLYTPEAQEEFVKLGFRPVNETVAQTKAVSDKFPKVKTLGVVDDFGGWTAVDKKFFADGGLFDQIQVKNKR